ncbi:uncharacterized protein LOC124405888 [Diprion similis]|uniref:uncharacterized protein LOC124405888 n=1 Tax=Diprion similis TaxID=362088 RepID=UPI001EF8136B|nr:uncharacterized protein LOC124405888 [Diprion similis]
MGSPLSPVLSDIVMDDLEQDCISKLDWFHKKTWSQRYLNFNLHQPKSYKIGTIKNLVDRAIRLSSPEFHSKNLNLIHNVLLLNNYPKFLITKHTKSKYNSILASHNNNNNSNIDILNSKNFIALPYVAGLFESLNRIFHKYNISFVGTNIENLQPLFDSGKDPLPKDKRSNIVYKIPCSDCNQVYIGQTSRQLHTRIREHKRNILENEEHYIVLTRHIITSDHRFNYDLASILEEEPVYSRRIYLEMCNIINHTNSVNLRQDIEHLSTIYLPIIRR